MRRGDFSSVEARHVLLCGCCAIPVDGIPTQRFGLFRGIRAKWRREPPIVGDSRYGISTLHVACWLNPRLENVQAILREFPKGASALRDTSGRTPLHNACKSFSGCGSEIVRALVDSNPDAVLIQDRFGRTALHDVFLPGAFGLYDPIRIEHVISRLGLRANNVYTLDTSENAYKYEIVKCLVKANPLVMTMPCSKCLLEADPFVPSANKQVATGMTPIEMLWYVFVQSKEGREQISEAFANGKKGLPLRSGGLSFVFKTMAFMIQSLYAQMRGFDGVDESTSLLLACVGIGRYCPPSFLRLVLSLHPEATLIANKEGRIPLHAAIMKQDSTTTANIESLLQACPDSAYVPDPDGRMPLSLAIIHGLTCRRCITMLLDAAPKTLQQRDSATDLFPFMLAASNISRSTMNATYEFLRADPSLLCV